MTNDRLSQTERGREPAEGRVDVSQPSDATARQAKREHERTDGSEPRGPRRADVERTDLDMDVPNEGFGIEPEASDEDLREALRKAPPID